MSESIPYLKTPEGAAFRDHMETKVAHWLKSWDGQEELVAGVVGIPLSKTSISHSGASTTPAAIRTAFKSFSTYSMEYEVDLQELAVRDLGDIQMHVTDLPENHRRIEESLRTLFQAHPQMVPILFGGDHSITYPAVKAFADRHPGKKSGHHPF